MLCLRISLPTNERQTNENRNYREPLYNLYNSINMIDDQGPQLVIRNQRVR